MYDGPMSTAQFRVSDRGQMALPAEARRRWEMGQGGTVEVADLGDALLIVPSGHGGLRALLRDSILEAGGYGQLAAEVAADEPDLG
jgi:AbrB family looped-hinge helix DNA binding protein